MTFVNGEHPSFLQHAKQVVEFHGSTKGNVRSYRMVEFNIKQIDDPIN